MAADPLVTGVPLSRYAAVLAYIGEGVPLEQSLDHAGLSAGEWPTLEEAFGLRIAESAAGDGALIEACDEHRLAAKAHVERALPPLDEELRAFFDFFRAFTASEDPLGFLGARGLFEGDVFRLLDLWQARMTANTALRHEAATILAQRPGPVPEVRPAPPRLLSSTRWPRRADAVAAGERGENAKPSLAETAVALPDLSKLVLPFVKAGTEPVVLPPSPARIGPRLGLGDTAPEFAAPIKPALPFASDEAFGVAPVEAPPPPMSMDEVAPKAPLAETALDTFGPVKPALPFTAAAPPALVETSLDTFGPVKPALPFAAPAAPVVQLSLRAYATLSAELAASPAAAIATLARYGLSAEGKRAEDEAWMAKFAAEPALRMEWMRELIDAGNRLRGGR